jgi:DNA-binding protein, histone-like, putative
MKYKLVERDNPQNRGNKKWYATPVNGGKITKTAISKEIVDMSSLSRGDVSNVIENLIDIMPKYLIDNKGIQLGEFGTLRLSFSSEGVDNEKDFHVSKIRNIKVSFIPSPEFRKALNEIKFERVEEK